MKRKVGFFLIVIVILLIIGGVIKLLVTRSPKEGELRVDASPNVSVFLDNKHLGRTPLREKVPAGEYTIRLVADSTTNEVAPWQSKIFVGPNLLTFVNAVLSDSELSSAVDVLWLEKSVVGKPELSIITNPDGASVVLDDVTKGITPLTISDVTAGDHSLTVTSPGFLTRTMKVKLTTGYKLIASMKLALSAAGGQPVESSPAAGVATTPTPSVKAGEAATSSATPQKPYVTIKDTPTGFLRVRMEPSTSATEAGRVNPGERYHIFNQQTGWYQISHDGTNKGWISAQYADKTE
ncbi:PEGA domain-containing protein [Candidatus Gottesmanbacteria bacterium]|nr:PEGA domain-containing protein [Candidatus Gottesmanbacteria bacterium]